MTTAISGKLVEIKRPEVTRVEDPKTVKVAKEEAKPDRRGSAPGRIGTSYNERRKRVPGGNKASTRTSSRTEENPAVAAMQERRIVNRASSAAFGDDAPGSLSTRVGRRI